MHTIQNTNQLKITHLLVNYAYSVIEWGAFEQYPTPSTVYDINKNPSSGTFISIPAKAYNLNQVELKVYGLTGHSKELINRFILPLCFAPNRWTLDSNNRFVVSDIPTPGTSITLLLRFGNIVNYPSIIVEMNNIGKEYCDAYFIEVPKLITDVGIGTTEFNPVIERTEGDNSLYDKEYTFSDPSDEYEEEPEEPGWES